MGSKQGFTDTASLVKDRVIGFAAEPKRWVVAILGLVLVQFLLRKAIRGPKLPPGPRNWPLVGAIFSMEANLPRCFTKLARKFGPVFYLRLASHEIIVVSSLEAVKEVLKTKDSQFANRPNTTLMKSGAKYLGFESEDIISRDYDEKLKILRKACVTEFFTASKVAHYEDVRRHEGACMVEEISKRIHTGGSSAGRKTNVKIRETLTVTATNIMYMLLCGKRYSDAILSETDEFRAFPDLVQLYIRLGKRFNMAEIFPWLEWVDPQGLFFQYKEFQRLCRTSFAQMLEARRLLRKRTKNYEDRVFVDTLLTLQDSGKITEDNIMGTLINMAAGSLDTNIHTTEWALLELIKRPEKLAKIQQEIDEVVGRDRPAEESDYASMPYLQAVTKEIFRLHAPVPLLIPHANKSSTTLGGYYVPANTAVFVNTYAISRDPLLWGESPEEFNPERFLSSSNSNLSTITTTGNDYELLPFGSGRRMCPANNLGLLLVQRGIVTLLHAFDWTPGPGMAGVDEISRVEVAGIVKQLEVPLVLSATPRLAPGVYTSSRSSAIEPL